MPAGSSPTPVTRKVAAVWCLVIELKHFALFVIGFVFVLVVVVAFYVRKLRRQRNEIDYWIGEYLKAKEPTQTELRRRQFEEESG